MALTDPVPSQATDVFRRNMEDVDRVVNNTSGTVTNRTNTTMRPIPVIVDDLEQQINDFTSDINAAKADLYPIVKFRFLVDTYEIANRNELGDTAAGETYRYVGATLPFNVTPAINPVGNPDFVQVIQTDHNNLTNRNAVGAHSASAISTDSGKTVQAVIDESIVDWVASVNYIPGNRVRYSDKNYKAKVSNTNKQPNLNPTEWDIDGYWFQTGKNQLGDVLDAVNIIGGHSKNAIVPDTHSCVIGGGGLTNKENVIGGVEANVNTENSNVPGSWTLGDESQFCYIGGGYDNVVNGLANVIPVGQHCLVSRNADHGTVTGGSVNWILEGSYNSIYGGSRNKIYSDGYAVIVGGGDNYIGTVSTNSTISGGSNNQVYASFTTVSGGQSNIAFSGADTSAIAGGSGNKVRQANSAIGGGNGNEIQSTGQGSSISGGISNRANGQCASVMGGRENFAEKDYSVASGYQSEASVQGQQVFANGKFISQGDAQASRLILKGSTAGLVTNVVLQGIGNLSYISIRNKIAIAYKITLTAHETSNNGENALIILEGLAHRGASGSWQVLPLPERKVTTTNTASVSAEVYDAVGELRVRVNGASGQSLNWVALCEYTENKN